MASQRSKIKARGYIVKPGPSAEPPPVPEPPLVWHVNRLQVDENGQPLMEGIFSNFNDDLILELEPDTLLGRTDPARGPGQGITVEAPLWLRDGMLGTDAAGGGVVGPPGPTGPPGPGGASTSFFNYNFDKSTTASDPGPGKLRYNNASQNLATKIYADALTATGFDVTTMFTVATFNDHFVIQQKDLATNNQTWKLLGPAINRGGWFEVPVEFVSAGGPVDFAQQNMELTLLLRTTGAPGPTGPRGATGPQGAAGEAGPSGPSGPMGPVGPTGPKGAIGNVGPPGVTGPAGATGPQGLRGATGATGPQGPSVAVADAPPSSPADNSLWFESDSGNSYIRVNDGNSTQWVAFATPTSVGPTGATGPAGPTGATGPAGTTGPAGPTDWAGITGKPSTYPPTLPIPSSGVTGLDAKQASQDTAIDGKEPAIAAGVAGQYWDGTKTWQPLPTGGGASVTVSDTPPVAPTDNSLWFESDTGSSYIRVNDGNSTQWVAFATPGIGNPPSDSYGYLRVGGTWASGGTLSGDLGLTKAAPTLALDKTVAANPNLLAGRVNGLTRWGVVLGNGAAETGGNSGSNFAVSRYSDAGAYLDTPFWVERATGMNQLAHTRFSGGVELVMTNPALNLRKTASGQTNTIYGSTGTTPRWLIEMGNATAESGTQTGSDFLIHRYANDGNWIGQVLSISRETAEVFIKNRLYIDGEASNSSLVLRNTDATNGLNHITSERASQSLWQIMLGSASAGDAFIGCWPDAGGFLQPLIFRRADGSVEVKIGRMQYQGVASGVEYSEGFFFGTPSHATSYIQGQATPGVVAKINMVVNGTGIFEHNNTGSLIINGQGSKPGGGVWADSSDARIKAVLGDYTAGLDAILGLRPVRYTFRGNDTRVPPTNADPEQEGKIAAGALAADAVGEPAVPYRNSPHYLVATAGTEFIGLVAQEAEATMPELVGLRDGFVDGVPVTDLRDLDTGPLQFAVINSIKELKAQLDTLSVRLSSLEAR